jgi:hypothetical protein
VITPAPEDIEKFRGYSEVSFEQWLRLALEGYYLDNLGVQNFAPIDYCILREHTLAADLKIIYDSFSSNERASIRLAVANLLSHLPFEPRYVPIFRVLLNLAPSIGAHEVLKVIPARANGFLSIEREAGTSHGIYGQTLETVVELADQTSEAKACIERLVGTPAAFDIRYAPKALLALCKIAPDEFVRHVALLREPLSRNFQTYHPTPEGLHWLAYDLLKAVGLATIEANWHKLRIVDAEVNEPNENWLHAALVQMLRKEESDHAPAVIVANEEPDVRATVTASLTDLLPPAKDTHVGAYPELPSDQLAPNEKEINGERMAVLLGTRSADELLEDA